MLAEHCKAKHEGAPCRWQFPGPFESLEWVDCGKAAVEAKVHILRVVEQSILFWLSAGRVPGLHFTTPRQKLPAETRVGTNPEVLMCCLPEKHDCTEYVKTRDHPHGWRPVGS